MEFFSVSIRVLILFRIIENWYMEKKVRICLFSVKLYLGCKICSFKLIYVELYRCRIFYKIEILK